MLAFRYDWLVCLCVTLLVAGCLFDLLDLAAGWIVCGFDIDVLIVACCCDCGLVRLLFGCLFLDWWLFIWFGWLGVWRLLV